MRHWALVAGCALVAFGAVSVGQAAPDNAAACAAPKSLPAGVKKPPAGASATQLANFLLALPQRKPCDVNLFTSTFPGGTKGAYPEGQPMSRPTGPLIEEQVRAQLSEFMPAKSKRVQALRLFDRADAKAKIPEPTFRAAFAALVGTLGESTIGPLLGPAWAAIRVGGVPEGAVAASSVPSKSIVISRSYQYEHFGLLVGVISHEILHHDSTTPSVEEVILNGLTGIMHMQVLARHPELATSGTELSRQMNTSALLLINSRVPGSSHIAFVAPNGKGIAPGGEMQAPDLFTFWLEIGGRRGQGNDPAATSPAPPQLATVLRKLLAPGVALPKPLTYSKKTAQLFSRMNDTWLSPVDRLRVSVLLGLVSVDEIVEYTGLSRAKAATTFKLASIVAVMK